MEVLLSIRRVKSYKRIFSQWYCKLTLHIYYKNGNIRASGLYVNKKKDSTWNYFNEDSVLILSEQYKQGQLHGLRKTYYETGEIYIVRRWTDGIEDGIFKQYYINGELSVEAINNNGTLDGEYVAYYEDGTIFYSGFYKNGIKVGEWNYFDENGKLEQIIYE